MKSMSRVKLFKKSILTEISINFTWNFANFFFTSKHICLWYLLIYNIRYTILWTQTHSMKWLIPLWYLKHLFEINVWRVVTEIEVSIFWWLWNLIIILYEKVSIKINWNTLTLNFLFTWVTLFALQIFLDTVSFI